MGEVRGRWSRGEVGSAGQGGGPGAGPLGRVTQAVSLSEGPWCCRAFGACVLHTYCVSGHCSCKDCRELTRTDANPLPAHGWHADVGPCGGSYYFYYYHYSKEARPVLLAHTIPHCHLGGTDRRSFSRFFAENSYLPSGSSLFHQSLYHLHYKPISKCKSNISLSFVAINLLLSVHLFFF